MKPSSLIVGAVLVFWCGAWLACVGDDPSPTFGPAAGARLGACLPGRTCNAGLECHPPEEICLVPGESPPADAGDAAVTDASLADADGGTSDGSLPDRVAFDAAGCVATSSTTFGQVACAGGTTCAAGAGCCVGSSSSTCSTMPSCPINTGSRFFACDNGQCGAGNVCCISTALGSAGATCAKAFGASSSSCVGGSSCPSGQGKFCEGDTDCPASFHCELVEVDVSQAFKPIYKLCVP